VAESKRVKKRSAANSKSLRPRVKLKSALK
jgi:hypothetical protein